MFPHDDCITKHSPQYKILLIGRILGGISTSLLFSSFESWLAVEHNKRGFEQQWLSLTFSKAIFLGNGFVAILAGLFGNLLVSTFDLGAVAPFDAASCFLAIGSIYTFVFLWTPALSPNSEDIPHGFIFSTFMLSSMSGSSFALRLISRASIKVESYMHIVFRVFNVPGYCNFLVPPSTEKGESIKFAGCIQLLEFCVIQSLCWIILAFYNENEVPIHSRGGPKHYHELFRIPLNIFVGIVLYNIDAFPISFIFGMCSIFPFIASLLQRRLLGVVERSWPLGKVREVKAEPLNT